MTGFGIDSKVASVAAEEWMTFYGCGDIAVDSSPYPDSSFYYDCGYDWAPSSFLHHGAEPDDLVHHCLYSPVVTGELFPFALKCLDERILEYSKVPIGV